MDNADLRNMCENVIYNLNIHKNLYDKIRYLFIYIIS